MEPIASTLRVSGDPVGGAVSVGPTWIGRIQVGRDFALAFVDQSGADLIGGKPAILKESGLLCTFGRRTGPCGSKLAPTNRNSNLGPVDFGCGKRPRDRFVRNSVLAQLCPNSDRSLSALCVVMNEACYETIVGHQPFRAELLYDAFDGFNFMTFTDQLALELVRSVLASSEKPNGSDFGPFFGIVPPPIIRGR